MGGLACCDSWGRKESDRTELKGLDFISLSGAECGWQLTGWGHGGRAENEKVNESTTELGVREGFHSYPEYET